LVGNDNVPASSSCDPSLKDYSRSPTCSEHGERIGA
jgi:hypothetical protein